MVGIAGYGAYVPVYRIERETVGTQHGEHVSEGEVAVPAHDEDVLTMAVTAAKDALDHAGVDPSSVGAVYTATTSDPFEQRGLAPHVGAAVGAGEATTVGDFQGSARAATNALLAARDALVAGRTETALVVGTDIPASGTDAETEATTGAGSGALVLTDDGDVADWRGAAVNTTGFIGGFTKAGESPVHGNQRFARDHGYLDAVVGALESVGAREADRAVVPSHADWGERALREADLDAEMSTTFDAVGNAAAASHFLDLGLALERAEAGERLLLASYGSGGSDAVVLETGPRVREEPPHSVSTLLESKRYVTYRQFTSYRDTARGVNEHA